MLFLVYKPFAINPYYSWSSFKIKIDIVIFLKEVLKKILENAWYVINFKALNMKLL